MSEGNIFEEVGIEPSDNEAWDVQELIRTIMHRKDLDLAQLAKALEAIVVHIRDEEARAETSAWAMSYVFGQLARRPHNDQLMRVLVRGVEMVNHPDYVSMYYGDRDRYVENYEEYVDKHGLPPLTRRRDIQRVFELDDARYKVKSGWAFDAVKIAPLRERERPRLRRNMTTRDNPVAGENSMGEPTENVLCAPGEPDIFPPGFNPEAVDGERRLNAQWDMVHTDDLMPQVGAPTHRPYDIYGPSVGYSGPTDDEASREVRTHHPNNTFHTASATFSSRATAQAVEFQIIPMVRRHHSHGDGIHSAELGPDLSAACWDLMGHGIMLQDDVYILFDMLESTELIPRGLPRP